MDKRVETILIVGISESSMRRRSLPGIIRGSPLLVATRIVTLGDRSGWPARTFMVKRWHSLRYNTKKVLPFCFHKWRTREIISIERDFVLESDKSRSRILPNRFKSVRRIPAWSTLFHKGKSEALVTAFRLSWLFFILKIYLVFELKIISYRIAIQSTFRYYLNSQRLRIATPISRRRKS